MEQLTRADFEGYVADAIDSIPDEFRAEMDNVEIVVEDEPEPHTVAQLVPRGHTLFGLYHGVPKTQRGIRYQSMPDKISIYRGPITRAFRTPSRIKEQVRRTVIHEVAHHFGIDDDRLHELGW
jgi:predicted Zn-dependent protease with MMP-like domain